MVSCFFCSINLDGFCQMELYILFRIKVKLQTSQLITKMCFVFFVLRIQSFKLNEAMNIFSNEKCKHKHHNFHIKYWIQKFFLIINGDLDNHLRHSKDII